jgi:hypothetical protein
MEALIQEMLDGKILLAEALREFEKIYIEKAVNQHDGHLLKTAETLGIHRNTLSSKLLAYKEADLAVSTSRPRKRNTVSPGKKRSSPKKLKARAAVG